jgi:hypothetical protein
MIAGTKPATTTASQIGTRSFTANLRRGHPNVFRFEESRLEHTRPWGERRTYAAETCR